MAEQAATYIQQLQARFPDAILSIAEARGEVTLEVPSETWHAACLSLRDDFGFEQLIDVSGIDCRVGDEVTLWGRTSGGAFLSAQRVGAAIGHEGVYFYSRLSHRVERVYINANSNH